jgi:hypothetical protein
MSEHATHQALFQRSPYQDRQSPSGRCMSKSAAARLFGVSLSSGKRYSRIASRTAPLAPKKGGGEDHSRRMRHQEATPRKPRGASGCHAPPEVALLGKPNGQVFEHLHHQTAVEAPWLQSKKRSVGAVERDEWLRGALRVMLAEKVEPQQQLVFLRTRWGRTLAFLSWMLGHI